MKFFSKLFSKMSNTTIKSQDSQDIMVDISNLTPIERPTDSSIIYESKIPLFIKIGNLTYEKKYDEAIDLGKKLLLETPMSRGVHINLMVAYFKARNNNPTYFEKSTEHARLAMLYGHNTGYAQQRLVVNLSKMKNYYQAMQICDIILMNEFCFEKHGCGTKEEFRQRKLKLLKNVDKSCDTSNHTLFSQAEIDSIIIRIKENKEREERERKERIDKLRK